MHKINTFLVVVMQYVCHLKITIANTITDHLTLEIFFPFILKSGICCRLLVSTLDSGLKGLGSSTS